jgi:hypothetical protein
VFSFGLVLYQLCCGDRAEWWPTDVDSNDVAAITGALRQPASFAQWTPIDAAWPLADLIRRCLATRAEDRPTALQLRDELLAAAQRCVADPAEAFRALVEQHSLSLLHDSRRARAEYQPPFATPLRGLSRVPEKEEKSDEAPRPVTAVVEEFLAPTSPHCVLLLLGDGGVGKSLTLQTLVAAPPQPWLPVQLRPALPQWSHSALRGAVAQSLQWYGASAFSHTAPVVLLLDSYDELSHDVAPEDDLPRVLGMTARMKLIVTARRTTVPDADLGRRFGTSVAVRYLLPFTTQQIQWLIRQRGVDDVKADSISTVVENPFLLQLYCDCRADVDALAQRHWKPGVVQRRHVYEAALSRWICDAARRGGVIDAVMQQLMRGTHSLEDSFVGAAQRIGHAMYAAGAVDSLHTDEPWAQLYSLTQDALRGKRAALVAFRLRELQTFLVGCPLRIRPAASFAHKSFRDYLAAAHFAAEPGSPDRALLTLDPAVQRFAAEFVDATATTAYTQNMSVMPLSPTPLQLGHRLVDILRTSRHPTVVANALTALNTAGVSFSGMNLAGIAAGSAEPPAPGTPFADLGGAMLAGANLSRADLRHCRLQQACLNGADLRHANLQGAAFGELPLFRTFAVEYDVRAVAVSPDGRFVYSGDDLTVTQWETSSGAVCT